MNKYINGINNLVELNIPESANVILELVNKLTNKWRVTQSSMMAEQTESKVNLPRFKYWPFTTTWTSSFTLLYLHFLICTIGLKVLTHRIFMRIKWVNTHTTFNTASESKYFINVRYCAHNINNSFTHSNIKLIFCLRII